MKTTDLKQASFPFDAEFEEGCITAYSTEDAAQLVINAETKTPHSRLTHIRKTKHFRT